MLAAVALVCRGGFRVEGLELRVLGFTVEVLRSSH